MNKQEIYKWLNINIETYIRTIKSLQNKVDNYDQLLQGPLDPFKIQSKEYYIDMLNIYKCMLNIYQQVKAELDVLQILTKCIRVSTISYDDNDISKNSYDYSLETDELTIEEFNTLDNYYKELELEND